MIVHDPRLIDALGLERAHLMGHSMGGWMATEMAVVAGARFGKLVLTAPAGLNDPAYPHNLQFGQEALGKAALAALLT